MAGPSYPTLCALLRVNERGEYMTPLSTIPHKAIQNFVLYWNILVSLITRIYTDGRQYSVSHSSRMQVTEFLPDNKRNKYNTEC